MRQIIAVVLLLISFMGYSQENPFSKSENHAQEESSTERYTTPTDNNNNQPQAAGACTTTDGEPDCDCDDIPDRLDLDECAANPGDPVPIDNYIPLLLITSIGFIVYVTRKEKNYNS